MRIRLNIRGQLLLIIILLLFGLSLQFIASSISQSNSLFISQTKEAYLNRDANLADDFNGIVQDTQNIINARVEGLVYSLISVDVPTPTVLISVYRTRYNELVSSAVKRGEVGYSLDESKLQELPLILQVDENQLDILSEIVNTGTSGIAINLQSKQDSVNEVISDVLFSRDRIVEDYYFNTTFYAISSNLLLNNISDFTELTGSLSRQVSTSGDLNYQASTQNLIINIQQNLTTMVTNLARVEKDWISTEFNTTSTLNQTLETFSTIGPLLNIDISNSLSALDVLISANPDQQILNDLISTFSDVSDLFSETNIILGKLLILRQKIVNFEDSALLKSLNSLLTVLNSVKSTFDSENGKFVVEFNKLENDLRINVQFLNLGITALLGVIVFIIVLPLLWNMRGSIVRLRKDIRLATEGKLISRKRKSYPDNELGEIESSFHELIDTLKEIVTLGQTSSSRLAGISEELAAGTEEASASINEVSHTINTISTGAIQQRSMINSISDQLRELQKQIREASYQINEASSFVLTVSQRTTILGLNASINAAKAGKFGKGFGIVADEIRELAVGSKESANQISELIDTINYSIREMLSSIQNEVNIIRDVAETTAEGSEQSNSSTAEQVIMISEISQTSNDLALLAGSLDNILKRFELE